MTLGLSPTPVGFGNGPRGALRASFYMKEMTEANRLS